MDPAPSVVGTALTPMNRRDLDAETMAHQVVADALADAGIAADAVDLVVFGNATAGRLLDQACIRGQVLLRGAGLSNAGIVNVDNSCAGGASALHLATLAARAGAGTVLAVGVEKMWTGDRAATLAGIEDGVPASDRAYLHRTMENPSGSVLMALNAGWAIQLMEERGATTDQFVAATVKARRARGPQPARAVPHRGDPRRGARLAVDRLAAHPPHVLVVHRRCGGGRADERPGPRVRRGSAASTVRSGNGEMDYHERLAEAAAAAWDDAGIDPGDVDVVELHDATSAEELYALESLGLYKPGDAGAATAAGDTSIGGKGPTVNPSGGLVSRGHPLGATGIAQVVELVAQLRDEAGPRQAEGARLAVAANTGGMIGSEGGTTDAAFIGIHVLEAG